MAKDKEVAKLNGGEVSHYNKKESKKVTGIQHKEEYRTIDEPDKKTVEHIVTDTIVGEELFSKTK